MDAGDLKVFEAVLRLRSMNRAAAELNTVQSNVTSRIRALELELGTALFDRHPRGVSPTAAGQRLWLDIGTAEGLRHVRDTELLYRRLILQGWQPGVNLELLKVDGGAHTEDAWAARFHLILKFLFPSS